MHSGIQGRTGGLSGHKGSLGVKGHSIRGLLGIKDSLGVEVCSIKRFVLCFPAAFGTLAYIPLYFRQSGIKYRAALTIFAPPRGWLLISLACIHTHASSSDEFCTDHPSVSCRGSLPAMCCTALHRAAHTVPMSAPLTHCIHPRLASAAPFICTTRSAFQRFTN